MPDGTGPTTYTAVTFAPVQSFIRAGSLRQFAVAVAPGPGAA